MQRGDFMLLTCEVDLNPIPATYAAEIRAIDLVARTVDCYLVDSGQTLTVDYSSGPSAAWPAKDEAGTAYVLATHVVWVPQDATPGSPGVVDLEFADGSRALGYLDPISPTATVQLYQQPYPKIELDVDTITTSDWPAHPAGEVLAAFRQCIQDDTVPAEELLGVFAAGWWSLAVRHDADPGRVGGAIVPFATVVHTTDEPTETWETLITNWTTKAGDGSCAHFAIGRTEADGVVQLVPIDHNANHAGGAGHGTFVAGAQSWHPNLVSVGIELHCAGAVQQQDGAWRFFDNGAPSGQPIPDDEVVSDPDRPGRGWQMVTEYQYAQLGALLDGLEATLAPLPAGCVADSVEAPPAYGVFPTGRVVGHVSLTAARRGDPWPPTCDWIRARLAGMP
jgi:N-acetylmuramoyl-L-alanine amidase